MKNIIVFVILAIILTGCKTYVPVPAPTPCCRNPYHDHYIAPPMLLWNETTITDTYQHKVERRTWHPTR